MATKVLKLGIFSVFMFIVYLFNSIFNLYTFINTTSSSVSLNIIIFFQMIKKYLNVLKYFQFLFLKK